MKLLEGIRVVAWQDAADGALARFLRELGAEIVRCETALRAADLAGADLLLENLGLARIGETGLSREQIESVNSKLIHVSLSAFGSHGPRRYWQGSELVASDPVGATWGTGVRRAPSTTTW